MDAPFSNHIDVFPPMCKKAQEIFEYRYLNEETLLEDVPFHNSLPSTDVVSVDCLRPPDRTNTDVITFICPFRVGVRFGPVCKWASNQ